GCGVAAHARVCISTPRTVPDRERIRPVSRNDERSPRDYGRRQHRWGRLVGVRIQMETGRGKPGPWLVRATSAPARVADVVRRAGDARAKALVYPARRWCAEGKG